MADILFRRAAIRDLQQIGRHIGAADAIAAQRFREAIVKRINVLRQFPESARPRPEFGPGVRTIPIGRYIVILRVEPRISLFCGSFTGLGI
jgi:plasmid stabilization system protein ParE